ncbi:uncharacterized protein LOC129590844 [Paramacrobiotus metropolitanus]|uniref:uncharacterized protein LOC129590844 n=1 Tax=Paramacrobiotus metropolitanus TaxID=2943436 RepID=UPI002445780B|nr:uncharacterized protein LOC129590844 [Paramacrobiotus metropolitanus]
MEHVPGKRRSSSGEPGSPKKAKRVEEETVSVFRQYDILLKIESVAIITFSKLEELLGAEKQLTAKNLLESLKAGVINCWSALEWFIAADSLVRRRVLGTVVEVRMAASAGSEQMFNLGDIPTRYKDVGVTFTAVAPLRPNASGLPSDSDTVSAATPSTSQGIGFSVGAILQGRRRESFKVVIGVLGETRYIVVINDYVPAPAKMEVLVLKHDAQHAAHNVQRNGDGSDDDVQFIGAFGPQQAGQKSEETKDAADKKSKDAAQAAIDNTLQASDASNTKVNQQLDKAEDAVQDNRSFLEQAKEGAAHAATVVGDNVQSAAAVVGGYSAAATGDTAHLAMAAYEKVTPALDPNAPATTGDGGNVPYKKEEKTVIEHNVNK